MVKKYLLRALLVALALLIMLPVVFAVDTSSPEQTADDVQEALAQELAELRAELNLRDQELAALRAELAACQAAVQSGCAAYAETHTGKDLYNHSCPLVQKQLQERGMFDRPNG